MHQEDQPHHTEANNGKGEEKMYWNKPQLAEATAAAHKPFVIEQKVLHHRLHRASVEFTSLHINSLIFECGILIQLAVQARTHSPVCTDTKADISARVFSSRKDHLQEKNTLFFCPLIEHRRGTD